MKYINKDAKIRMYDGSTPTPFYFEFCLDNGDLSAPTHSPDNERMLIMSRGKFTSCTHYITGNDMTPLEPIDISFSVMVNDSQKYVYLMDWVEGNAVNGHIIDSTKGDHPRLNGTVGILTFRDNSKKAYDIEYEIAGAGETLCYFWNEVYFDLGSMTMAEAEDGVNITFSGSCYGTVGTKDLFTSGTDVTA